MRELLQIRRLPCRQRREKTFSFVGTAHYKRLTSPQNPKVELVSSVGILINKIFGNIYYKM
jgi:hypothetical protein